MKYRQLKLEDIEKYKEDIYSCYMTNHLVLDSQNPLKEGMSVDSMKWFVETFINSSDSVIVGIFDSELLVQCFDFARSKRAKRIEILL